MQQAFYKLRAFLRWCGKKAFEEKPIISRWVIVACVRKSYRVGIPDPSRPDFPELGLSVFSNSAFYTNTAGVSLQYSFIPYPGAKVNRIPANSGALLKSSVLPLLSLFSAL
jgi:hypothetical protein